MVDLRANTWLNIFMLGGSKVISFKFLGNGQTGEITQDMDSLSKAAQKFLDREELKGCVFVPEVYLPGIPEAIDDPSKLALKEKTKRSIKGNFEGDKTERILYKSLQKIFQQDSPEEEECLVLHSHHLITEDGKNCEQDFIIVNKKHRYIMALEAKTTCDSL